jgi:hypothetical protein
LTARAFGLIRNADQRNRGVLAVSILEESEDAPALTVVQAQAQLERAEAALKAIEGPAWELEHAQIALKQIKNQIAAEADEEIRTIYEGRLPAIQARSEDALKAKQPTPKEMDVAAQAVLDARAALAKAEEL